MRHGRVVGGTGQLAIGVPQRRPVGDDQGEQREEGQGECGRGAGGGRTRCVRRVRRPCRGLGLGRDGDGAAWGP
ncbi:hypothetical protein NKH77_46120 [Streptomyces sp. M19]